ncbi:MAG TPA: RNA-binding cell elongation regulator Jag/EloR [Spirochaetales bacterium]|mgnify:CR=1 FL=1|nr:RNA-binding cell elongation regulator Jag/EloR [Spirochaetales bacterium]
MVKEFEGKTEKEAIDRAVEALGLNRDEFDVEIVETQKSGFLFKKGKVVIRVHVEDEDLPSETKLPENDFEHAIVDFVENLLAKMGYPGDVTISFREDKKIGLKISSDHSGILIGRKGKNLDAIQLLANVVAGKLSDEEIRVVIDAENYRTRREQNLVRMARKVGEQVRRTKGSRLLEPMNPFERRLVHTALNDFEDVDTKSEGEGLYKQVRVYYRGVDRGNN